MDMIRNILKKLILLYEKNLILIDEEVEKGYFYFDWCEFAIFN